MLKNLLFILSILLFVTMCSIGQRRAYANSIELNDDIRTSDGYQEAKEIFESDRASIQKKADKALDNLIRVTIGELKKRKQVALANEIQRDYDQKYKGFILRMKPGRQMDIGEHEAIAWLKLIHEKIHAVLTDKICRALRFHDLWTLAYALPVVFSCVDHVDYPEYYKHYSPFLGVVAYWISYGGCAFASMGSGVVFLCGLVGMGCEVATVQLIVPITCKAMHSMACD